MLHLPTVGLRRVYGSTVGSTTSRTPSPSPASTRWTRRSRARRRPVRPPAPTPPGRSTTTAGWWVTYSYFHTCNAMKNQCIINYRHELVITVEKVRAHRTRSGERRGNLYWPQSWWLTSSTKKYALSVNERCANVALTINCQHKEKKNSLKNSDLVKKIPRAGGKSFEIPKTFSCKTNFQNSPKKNLISQRPKNFQICIFRGKIP
jgi:hypothetical protein